MSRHVVFNGCNDAVKERIEEYWAKKLQRLEKLLVHYGSELCEIRLTVYCHQQNPQREWYETRGVIHLPTGTLAAESNDKVPHVAIDSVADTLVKEIKRHKEHVRHEYLFKRKARRSDISDAGPQLENEAERGRREDFFRLLRPMLGFLADHARRELVILKLEGRVHPGEITVSDLLDGVVVRAWEQFGDRPKNLHLHLWLTDLLHEVLTEWRAQEPQPHASLKEPAEQKLPDDATDPDNQQEWWAELLDYDESLKLEDVIPDPHSNEAGERLDSEEQKDRVYSLLRMLPMAQRQAFLLHTLEDYDLAEIAMLQDRPESEVKADIEAARQALRKRILAEATRPEMAAAGKGN